MYYLSVDIGASSGRHIVGWQENGEIKTNEVFRFPNGVKEENGHLIWDVRKLFSNVVTGIMETFKIYPQIESLSIDTWGVDYVLLKGDEEVYPRPLSEAHSPHPRCGLCASERGRGGLSCLCLPGQPHGSGDSEGP